jgi:hypothetical protein
MEQVDAAAAGMLEENETRAILLCVNAFVRPTGINVSITHTV